MNNEYTSEQLQEIFNLSKILTTIVIAIFIAMWIILFIQWILDLYVKNKWFRKLMEHGATIEFIQGRLKFNDGKFTAPFPSMLVTINQRDTKDNPTLDLIRKENRWWENE